MAATVRSDSPSCNRVPSVFDGHPSGPCKQKSPDREAVHEVETHRFTQPQTHSPAGDSLHGFPIPRPLSRDRTIAVFLFGKQISPEHAPRRGVLTRIPALGIFQRFDSGVEPVLVLITERRAGGGEEFKGHSAGDNSQHAKGNVHHTSAKAIQVPEEGGLCAALADLPPKRLSCFHDPQRTSGQAAQMSHSPGLRLHRVRRNQHRATLCSVHFLYAVCFAGQWLALKQNWNCWPTERGRRTSQSVAHGGRPGQPGDGSLGPTGPANPPCLRK